MILPKHDNNFDLLRLVAAWLILFGHSYTLYGAGADPLVSYLHYDDITQIALQVFFVISGYLVTNSWIEAAA